MEWVVTFIVPWIERGFTQANPSRFFESLLLLLICWFRLKPWMEKQLVALIANHLTKVEDALDKLRQSVESGFAAGEARFRKIEDRVTKIEETR